MNVKEFEALYKTTYALKPALDKFWSIALYDLEGESTRAWKQTRECIESNCLKQRKMLEEYFQNTFPTSQEEVDLSNLGSLLKEFPHLVEGNKETCLSAARRFSQ